MSFSCDSKILKLLEHSEINHDTGCWEWQRAKNHYGYGMIRVNGKTLRAHRVIFELFRGYLPPEVRHTCDNPGCINPNHLVGGTHADNMRDMAERGRANKPWGHTNSVGSKNSRAKLTEEDVIEIRYLLSLGGLTQTQIGQRFGVSRFTVSNIKLGKDWKHVK